MSGCVDGKQSRPDKWHRFLNDNQRSVLNQWFQKDQYPTQDTIRNLSNSIGVDKGKVHNWFNIKRSKLRKSGMPLTQCKLKDIINQSSTTAFGQTINVYILMIHNVLSNELNSKL